MISPMALAQEDYFFPGEKFYPAIPAPSKFLGQRGDLSGWTGSSYHLLRQSKFERAWFGTTGLFMNAILFGIKTD
jgi:hypothetical protein